MNLLIDTEDITFVNSLIDKKKSPYTIIRLKEMKPSMWNIQNN